MRLVIAQGPRQKKSANKRKCLCGFHTRKLDAVSNILQGPRQIKTPVNENFCGAFLQGSSMRLVCQIRTLIDGNFYVAFLQGSSMRLVCQITTLIDGHFYVSFLQGSSMRSVVI